jgi:hypothetical protein
MFLGLAANRSQLVKSGSIATITARPSSMIFFYDRPPRDTYSAPFYTNRGETESVWTGSMFENARREYIFTYVTFSGGRKLPVIVRFLGDSAAEPHWGADGACHGQRRAASVNLRWAASSSWRDADDADISEELLDLFPRPLTVRYLMLGLHLALRTSCWASLRARASYRGGTVGFLPQAAGHVPVPAVYCNVRGGRLGRVAVITRTRAALKGTGWSLIGRHTVCNLRYIIQISLSSYIPVFPLRRWISLHIGKGGHQFTAAGIFCFPAGRKIMVPTH